MINQEIIKTLNEQELDLILTYIESDYIRKEVQKYVKELPDFSIYKFGGKHNGNYWRGFTKFDKIPYCKIKTLLANEFKHEVIQNLVIDGLNRKHNTDDQEALKKDILSNANRELADVLAKIYGLDLNVSYEAYIEDKQKLEEQYHANLKEETSRLSNHYEEIIEDLKNKNHDLNNKINDLNNKNDDLNNELKALQARILKKIINDDKMVEHILTILKNDGSKLDNYINGLLIDNQRKFANNEDFSDLLILEYVLLRMRGNR